MNSRGIITYAVGKSKQIERAKALARSLIFHDPTVKRAIITDSTDRELGDLFTYRVHLRPGYGHARSQKLFLDRYSPFDETLFLDSDSLAIRNLDDIWAAFKDVPFGVSGKRVVRRAEKHPDLDLPFVLDHFHLACLPAFSGAAYYFKHSAEARAVFDTARELSQQASELRFTTRSGIGPKSVPNDAAIFSVAMALHGLSGTDMGTGGMYTAVDSTTRLRIDVRNGICHLAKRGKVLAPHVVHAAKFVEGFEYLRECSILERQAHGLPEPTRGDMMQLHSTAAILWTHRKVKETLHRLAHIVPAPSTSLTEQY